VYEVIMASTMI